MRQDVSSGPGHGERPGRAGDARTGRTRWLLSRGLLGAILLGLLAVAALALARPEPRAPVAHPPPPSPAPEPTPSPAPIVPPRPLFEFSDIRVSITSILHRTPSGRDRAEVAAQSVGVVLSALYDRAFLDPGSWSGGLPSDFWTAFSPNLRKRARSDAASFSLGEMGSQLTSLGVVESALNARVLLDPWGHPQAVFADVRFEADGGLTDGRGVVVTNEGTYLLMPAGSSWVITGYPAVKTKLSPFSSPAPSPSALPAPSATPAPGSNAASPSSARPEPTP